jgi:hypothetical protein
MPRELFAVLSVIDPLDRTSRLFVWWSSSRDNVLTNKPHRIPIQTRRHDRKPKISNPNSDNWATSSPTPH